MMSVIQYKTYTLSEKLYGKLNYFKKFSCIERG